MRINPRTQNCANVQRSTWEEFLEDPQLAQ